MTNYSPSAPMAKFEFVLNACVPGKKLAPFAMSKSTILAKSA